MRSDIQCLRGIAIILVLLYHLYPSVFVNGYLGVDIFFVISGFLMATTLTSHPSNVFKFYYRRFKRILPLYYLTLLVALLAVQFCLSDFWWLTNHRYAKSALLLKSNLQLMKDGGNYFNQFQTDISSMNVFIHTWSLGVEMQFYLIVPFIFIALQHLKTDHQKLIAATVICVIGYVAFEMAIPSVSYSFMSLRLWQFSAGFLAFYGIKKIGYGVLPSEEKVAIQVEEETDEKMNRASVEPTLKLIALMLISLAAMPFGIEFVKLRLIVTMATAFLIAFNPDDNIFLTSPTLCYIGDISYVMYLVHWPIITILNSYFVPSYGCVAAIIASSIILHEFFEKQYLKLEWKYIVPMTIILFVGNVALQYSISNDKFWMKEYPFEIQKVINKNRNASRMSWETNPDSENCVKDVITEEYEQGKIFGQCRYTGHGNLSVMLIGNSYAMTFEKSFREQFHQNYSSWKYMALDDNLGVYGNILEEKLPLELTKRHVKLYKPDVLIIRTRYVFDTHPYPIQPHDDKVLSAMNETLAFYQKLVNKIYIINAFPIYPTNFLNNWLHHVVRQRDDLESFHLNKKTADDVTKEMKERLGRVSCDKCRFFDL